MPNFKFIKIFINKLHVYVYQYSVDQTSLVAWWSELLTTNHEVPGSIPSSTVCVFP